MRKVKFNHVPDAFISKYEAGVYYDMEEAEFEALSLFLLNDICEVIE